MRLRLSTLPLVAGFSAGAGATTALLLGAFIPGWGLTAGVALALSTFAMGLFIVPGHRELVLVATALSALVFGFIVATVPTTLVGLEDFIANKLPQLRSLARETVGDVQARLYVRWTVAAMAAIATAAVVWRKRER